MWKKMRIMLLSSVLLTAPTLADSGQSTGGDVSPFDGEWVFKVTPDSAAASDGQDAFSEAVLFHNGEFSAAAFAMFGFSPAAFTVTQDEGVYTFTTTLSSSDRGTLVWTGKNSAAGIVGTMIWSQPEGVTYRYQVVGERPDLR